MTVITEIIGESRGLGYVVAFSSASFEPARAMAAFAVIAAIGFTFDRTLTFLRRRLIYWQKERNRLPVTAAAPQGHPDTAKGPTPC